jgi:hypothetical protein
VKETWTLQQPLGGEYDVLIINMSIEVFDLWSQWWIAALYRTVKCDDAVRCTTIFIMT